MRINLYINYPKVKLGSGESKGLIDNRKIEWSPDARGLYISVYDESGALVQGALIPIERKGGS